MLHSINKASLKLWQVKHSDSEPASLVSELMPSLLMWYLRLGLEGDVKRQRI